MRMLLIVPALAALVVTGCATQDTQVAKAECKVVPITTASATGKAGAVSTVRQREAEMQLATSDYRVREFARRGMADNNLEEALRDCY